MANLAEKLWKDKSKNIPNPLAFSEIAEKMAKKISEEGGRNRNKTSQLRKFYDELFKLNQRAKQEGAEWDVVLAQVHMLVAKATYARGRDLVTENFLKMFRELVKAIENQEHFQMVTNFMESFMAYYKYFRPRD